VFHTKRAAEFWQRVVEHVGDVLEDLVVRWDREGWPAPRGRRAVRARGIGGNGGVSHRPGISAVPPPPNEAEKTPKK
jgi:hypothetical protein